MLPEPIDPKNVLPFEAGHHQKPASADLPGVSIVTPIYNAGLFLEKTIRSLLLNDLSGVELILMDGGSTDNTMEIVEHYRDCFAIIVSEKDEGQSDAINKGFARATKPILTWLNGDDLFLPNAVTEMREAFAKNPGTEVAVGNAYMTEVDFKPIRHFKFSAESLAFSHLLDYAKNHLVQPSVFFTKTAWEAAGPLKNELHYAMDADLFLGMASRFTFLHVPVDVAYSVYHEFCKTRGKRGESITELALVQSRHGGFDEARKTLDILVDLFNKAEENANAVARPSWDQGEYGLVARRLDAFETETRKSRANLLAADIEALS